MPMAAITLHSGESVAANWLVENGPRELELLFRAIIYHPSAPILLADNDRYNRELALASTSSWVSREKRS